VQVGGERVEDAGPPRTRRGQQVLDAAGADEPADRLLGQAEFPHDRLDALALGDQRLHRRVPLLGADHDGPAVCTGGGRVGRDLLDIDGRAR
jgi:hypothetical protein